MNFSYWEYKEWFTDNDFVVVGSGIVGLNCAIHLKERFPKSKVIVLEKGLLPQGASTKNAGFACFSEPEATYALANVALSPAITRGPLRCARVTPSEIEGRRKNKLRKKKI